ncbi:PEGA domain-containing protein [Sorangium sp. So ce281]|uniref:PEGA domain-containing protein n=1 Tax=unclassified Sorangium TaxID=2621164 RepID=UPI003F610AAC
MTRARDRRTTPRRSCRSVAPAVALLLASALVTRGDRAEARPAFDVAYNVGSAAYQQGKHALAAEHLSFALRGWPLLSAVAHLKPTAQQRLATSRAHVGALAVTVSAPLAEVRVDGKPAGKAPLAGEIFVEPGEHAIEARLDGYAPALKTVRVAKGETAAVTLTLALAKSEAAAEARENTAAVDAARAPAGKAAGHGPSAVQLAAKPGQNVAVPAHVEQRSWVPVIALGAASAMALGVGVGMTVAANDATAEARSQQEEIFAGGGGCLESPAFAGACREFRHTTRRSDDLSNAAVVTYAASGAMALTALAFALCPRGSESAAGRAAVRVVPGFGVRSAGISVRTAW